MIKKLITYGLIGFAAFYAFTNLDMNATKPALSKAEQYKSDRETGIQILRGYCDDYVGNMNFKECNDPRYLPLNKTSNQYNPAIVKRWQETFFEDFCYAASDKYFEFDGDSWCRQYSKYTYEVNSINKDGLELSDRLSQYAVRKKWFLEDSKYRHACYYYKQKPAIQKEYTACPGFALRNLDASTDDWSVIK